MAFNEQPSNPKPDEVVDGADAGTTASARQLIDEAKRHFALKEYTASSDKAAQALEQLSSEYAEDADQLAPVLHLYGKSLLENFILNSAALGGGGGSAPLPAPTASIAGPSASSSSSKAAAGSSSSAGAVKSDPRFSFSGDAEDDDDDEDEAAAGAAGGEDDDDDDLQVAFSVLDLGRVIYQRILSSSNTTLSTLDGQEWNKTRIQAELAEVMNHLGDVGLEAENFSQASTDYKSSLDILLPLLNAHSRRLADAHLRLGLALEFHPDVEQRKGAKAHVQAASDVLAARVAAIQARLSNPENTSSPAADESKEKDDLANLTDAAALQKELDDVSGMKKEIDSKLDEYETEDGQAQLNGQPDLTGVLGLPSDANALRAYLQRTPSSKLSKTLSSAPKPGSGEGEAEVNPFTGAAKSAGATDAPVNNLSSMVKRKKKVEGEDAPAAVDAAAASGRWRDGE